MKLKQLVVIALTAGLPAWSLLAQNDGQPPSDNPPPPADGGPPGGFPGGPGPGPGRRGHRPPPLPIILALDANHDGIISAEEIANAPAALKTLDKNGDGQLTMDELLPPRPPGGPDGPGGLGGDGPPDGPPPPDAEGKHPHHRPVPPIIAALDTNGDGVISADEIANASASLLKLDKNGDGQLTMDELRPKRPHPPGDNQQGQ